MVPKEAVDMVGMRETPAETGVLLAMMVRDIPRRRKRWKIRGDLRKAFLHGWVSNCWCHNLVMTRAVEQLISLITLIAWLIFLKCINRGFNAHFVCYIFSLFVFHLQVDVVGPLLLNASLLLVLTIDYSDWLLQVDVVGPLLLNASLLLVLMIDYSDWLLQVTELVDSWQWRSLLSFDDCVIV